TVSRRRSDVPAWHATSMSRSIISTVAVVVSCSKAPMQVSTSRSRMNTVYVAADVARARVAAAVERPDALAGSRITALSSADLMGEMLGDATDRIRGGLAEAANRSIGHGLRQLLQQRPVPDRLGHQTAGLRGSDTARRALATGLVLEKAHHVEGGVACSIVLREHDHGGR